MQETTTLPPAVPPSAAFLTDVRYEIVFARKSHGPMRSLHEGIAVLWEEFEEAKAEVFKKHPDLALLRKELVQVAAMAERMVAELIETK